jgi:hypothetical protein
VGLIPNIILDLCQRAGIPSTLVDVSAVTAANLQPVSAGPGGYLIERPQPAAAALREICSAFFIDARESSGMLRFVPRASQKPPYVIPETDLGLAADKAELAEELAQESDLPVSVTVLYIDATLDYQQGKQLKARNPRIVTVATRNQTVLSLPFNLTPDQGRQIAETTLYVAWTNRLAWRINLWRAGYGRLDPADFVSFVYQGVTYTARIMTSTVGVDGSINLDCVADDPRNYVSDVVGGVGGHALSAPGRMGAAPRASTDAVFATSSGLAQTASTTLFLFDVPLLQDTDSNPAGSGLYYALTSAAAPWPGAVLYQSTDDQNRGIVGEGSIPAAYGVTVTALAAPRSPWTWDDVNSLTVAMYVGGLAGDTDFNVLCGSNALIVGDELIQFADAVDNGDGTYTLSRLLRGRRATEWACASHTANETVLAPQQGGFARLTEPVTEIGVLRYYRAVSIGTDPSTITSQQFTLTGADVMPYAPVGIGGYILTTLALTLAARSNLCRPNVLPPNQPAAAGLPTNTSGGLAITWCRRTRLGGAWLDGNGIVPVSEAGELYDVDILDATATTVVRTFSRLTSPSVVYTLAQQTADFGSPRSSYHVRVYQRSATVGRGFAGSGVAPTPGGWPAPWPQS